jgi:hypothetical protein
MIHDTLQDDIEQFIRNGMKNRMMDEAQINIYRKEIEAMNKENL